MKYNRAVHAANQPLFDQVRTAAAAIPAGLTVYHTGKGGWSGWKRYTVFAFPEQGRPHGSRSLRTLAQEDAPFQGRFAPSIVGERRALQQLLDRVMARGDRLLADCILF